MCGLAHGATPESYLASVLPTMAPLVLFSLPDPHFPEKQSDKRQREASMCCFTSHAAATAGAGPSPSQELRCSLPCGWQGPWDSGRLPWCISWELVPIHNIWDSMQLAPGNAHVAGCGGTTFRATLPVPPHLSPGTAGCWARLEPGAWSSLRVSYMEVRGSVPWAITCSFPRHRELCWQWDSRTPASEHVRCGHRGGGPTLSCHRPRPLPFASCTARGHLLVTGAPVSPDQRGSCCSPSPNGVGARRGRCVCPQSPCQPQPSVHGGPPCAGHVCLHRPPGPRAQRPPPLFP